jgi:hypothetical protein
VNSDTRLRVPQQGKEELSTPKSDPDAKSRRGVWFVCFMLMLGVLSFGYLSFGDLKPTRLTLSLTGMSPIDDLFVAVALHPVYFGLFVGSAIVLAYLILYEFELPRWKEHLEHVNQTTIQKLDEKKDEKKQLLEVSRQAREVSMLNMGSLFIPTAFVMLGAAATAPVSQLARATLAFSAPLLYVIWLFLVQLPTRLMDDVDSKMRLIVGDPVTRVLHEFYGDRHGIQHLTRLRRNHWLAYVPLLTIAASLIISSVLTSTPPFHWTH